MNALISNPPYNMKWQLPPFAQLQQRFCDCELPPAGNANYAFILTALDMSDRAVFLLPCGILTSGNKQEQAIRKYLLEKNFIETVITLPNNMFEKTNIATCIIVLNKHRQMMDITMIDMRRTYDTEDRLQKGQYGGKSHENRTYTKKVNVLSDEHITRVLTTIKEQTSEPDFSVVVSNQRIIEDKCNLLPSHYFDITPEDNIHRPYEDILDDLNRIISEKNLMKLTINETIAKSLGLYEFGQMQKESRLNAEQISANMEALFDKKIAQDNYISLTKNKGQVKFENMSKDEMSPIFAMIFQMYKAHIYYLNDEENRYLVELRDALLPDLMSGKLEIPIDKPHA